MVDWNKNYKFDLGVEGLIVVHVHQPQGFDTHRGTAAPWLGR